MNPITVARGNAGVSKSEFSKRMGLSRTWILRAEEGCYANPGTKLVEFSCYNLDISHSEFFRRYRTFQANQRKRSAEHLEPIQIVNRVKALSPTPGPVNPDDCPVGSFPIINSEDDLENYKAIYMNEIFKEWRVDSFQNTVNFAKALCVHPSSVDNYERGNYDAMPILIEEALNSVKLIDKTFDPRLKWCYVYK